MSHCSLPMGTCVVTSRVSTHSDQRRKCVQCKTVNCTIMLVIELWEIVDQTYFR